MLIVCVCVCVCMRACVCEDRHKYAHKYYIIFYITENVRNLKTQLILIKKPSQHVIYVCIWYVCMYSTGYNIITSV